MTTCAETRTGFAFNNPDTSNNYHAPGWGMLVTADELRYDELFGNQLIAEADGQSFTDEQLLDYARLAIAYMERELKIDILPRLIRYDNLIDENGNEIERTDIDDSAYLSKLKTTKQRDLYIREFGYPYRIIQARYESFIKLRRRPVIDVLTAKIVDPYYANTVIDLMPYRLVKKGLSGTCYFRPRHFTARTNTWMHIWNTYLFVPYSKTKQNIFLIDYKSGYENCANVPDDIRNIVKKIAAVTLMNTYGDGKFAAIASRSVNLNSVSESISTTMSATSATFGARILQYQKEIKEWFAMNRSHYARTIIGNL